MKGDMLPTGLRRGAGCPGPGLGNTGLCRTLRDEARRRGQEGGVETAQSLEGFYIFKR